MRMNRLLLSSASLSLMVACASGPPPLPSKQETCATLPSAGAILALEDIHYDGENLFTRIMVGGVKGSVCLDRRFLVNASGKVDSVRECDTGLTPATLPAEPAPAPPREEDLLILEPGQWYGAEVRVPLFSAQRGVKGPDCVDAQVSLLPLNGAAMGPLFVRKGRDIRD